MERPLEDERPIGPLINSTGDTDLIFEMHKSIYDKTQVGNAVRDAVADKGFDVYDVNVGDTTVMVETHVMEPSLRLFRELKKSADGNLQEDNYVENIIASM